jgi:glutamate synthase domain-containing protein 2
MVNKGEFLKAVENLKKIGAKHVFLKTGAYRPSVLASAIKYSSEAGIDLLTIDGAGGGTGMSPWRMMNEWGVPTVYLQCLAYNQAKVLADKDKYVPDLVIAGGFTLEDLIFKGLALGAPYFKAVGMARSPITASMVGKTIANKIKNNDIPASIKKYGDDLESIFIEVPGLKKRFNSRFDDIPGSAIGLISYFKRLEQGLKQLMCGARKFSLEYIERDDLASLTNEASQISGIPYVMDLDKKEVDVILNSDLI